jgi:hypothetical protein
MDMEIVLTRAATYTLTGGANDGDGTGNAGFRLERLNNPGQPQTRIFMHNGSIAEGAPSGSLQPGRYVFAAGGGANAFSNIEPGTAFMNVDMTLDITLS